MVVVGGLKMQGTAVCRPQYLDAELRCSPTFEVFGIPIFGFEPAIRNATRYTRRGEALRQRFDICAPQIPFFDTSDNDETHMWEARRQFFNDVSDRFRVRTISAPHEEHHGTVT